MCACLCEILVFLYPYLNVVKHNAKHSITYHAMCDNVMDVTISKSNFHHRSLCFLNRKCHITSLCMCVFLTFSHVSIVDIILVSRIKIRACKKNELLSLSKMKKKYIYILWAAIKGVCVSFSYSFPTRLMWMLDFRFILYTSRLLQLFPKNLML